MPDAQFITNEPDTVTRCRVEGCRVTQPEHHKFRPKKSDTATCKTCGEKGKWHPNHTFEPGYAPVDPAILAACVCGTVARSVTGLKEFHPATLKAAGWSLRGAEWKCPSCTQKAEKRAVASDPRQGSFL